MKYTEEMILQSESGYCMPFEERPGKDVELSLGYGEQTDPATGEPEGQGRRIESDYAMFIIQNFVSHYIAIYPPEGE